MDAEPTNMDAEPTNGSGGMREEIRAAQAEIRALTTGELLARYQFARQAGITFGGARDEYEVLGYDRVITNKQYRDEYARGGIAGRIVDALPNATWRGSMELIEDEDPDKVTAFEQAWDDLDVRLQVQAKLMRVDKLAGLSTYAVLLIGAPGELDAELPKGRPEQLIYLTPFSGGGGPGGSPQSRTVSMDADASVFEFDLDTASPRFGSPQSYQLKRTDISSPILAKPVHWSRIIHVAENLLDDDVYGQPTLERVWNLLIDLRKVTGGGAEAFWLRANQGMHVNVDKDMATTDLPAVLSHLKEQSEAYKHQLDRWIRTKGVDVNMLGSDVANFSNPADAVLTQISGAKSIPKRILTGSEMGELASSQDRDNWKDQVNGRQTGYAGPYIVRPLVDRLIKYGYLPTPAKGVRAYEVRWPQITTMTEQEKVAGAAGWANVNASQGSIVFTDAEIREKWADKAPLSDEQKAEIEEANAKKVADAQAAMGEAADEEEELKAASEHKYSSTQVQLPQSIAKKLLAFGASIADEDLAADGRETDAHIMVKYGLHTNDVADVREVIADSKEVELTLGKSAFFAGKDFDVLYVAVESQCLMKLNKKLSNALEVTDTHTRYTPHATVAYLKPGLGKKYAGDTRMDGVEVTIGTVKFSPAEGEEEVIQLNLRAAQSAEEEVIRVLAAAIECGATEVVDAIVGIHRG